jgi:nicotinamide-nucleotide amidase
VDACILTVGDELLEGRVDTNSAWLSLALDPLGFRVVEVRHCRDALAAIVRNIDELRRLAPVVLLTGGLGPTTDDRTTEAVAAWAGVQQVLHEPTWTWIRERFQERRWALPPENRKQAEYPAGATPMPNHHGTAMGYIVEKDGGYVAALPGVPAEMQAMAEESLLPFLKSRFLRDRFRVVNRLRVFGLTESRVNQLLGGLLDDAERAEIAYLASFPEVSVYVKAEGDSEEAASREAARLTAEAKRRLGDKVYAEGDMSLEASLGSLLVQQGRCVAVAESCTGGLIAKRLTDVPGSSAYLTEAVVTYGNDAKMRHLGVRRETLASFGAVSAETCDEMLQGILKRSNADVAAAVTGIAGPGGGSADKPVGLVFIAWGDADGHEVREYRFQGTRGQIRELAASVALDRLRRFVLRQGRSSSP